MYQTILLQKKDRVAKLILNRPEHRNAFTAQSYEEMIQALEDCDRDVDIGAVVITGAGKHFSAGGDIVRFRKLLDDKAYLNRDSVERTGQMAAAIRCCGKPVIAMVNNAAAGAGCSVALASDFRIMSPSSKLVCSFANVALPGDSCCLYSLQRMVGTAKATEMMMTASPIGGEEAFRLGLATKLVDEEHLATETDKLATRLAHGPGMVYRCQKELLYRSFYSDLPNYVKLESEHMERCSKTADFEEAVNAFLEKRAPVFQGK